MTEAEEIAASMISKYGNPNAATWDEAREWLIKLWPNAREWVGDQTLANVATAVLQSAAPRSIGGPGFEGQAEDPTPPA